MHSLFVFALFGSVAPSASPSPLVWQTDYTQAHQLAAQQHKPLAVFVGTGSDGWSQLVQGGSIDSTTLSRLSENYVLVYADRGTSHGMKTAQVLEVNAPSGLVISDATGKVQAFSHSGSLNSVDLSRTVEKYSDSTRIVTTTETLSTPVIINSGIVQTSYSTLPSTVVSPVIINQAPMTTAPVIYVQGSYIQPATYVMPSSCPNGRCPNAR
jgi:hypothetical protein